MAGEAGGLRRWRRAIDEDEERWRVERSRLTEMEKGA